MALTAAGMIMARRLRIGITPCVYLGGALG